MLDIKFIRENQELVRKTIQQKGIDLNLDRLLELDRKRKELLTKTDELRKKSNEIAEKMKNKDLSKQEREKLIKHGRDLRKQISGGLEKELTGTENEYDQLMLLTPNIPSEDTPIGLDDTYNKEIYRWGEPKKFSFPMKDHVELGTLLNILDLERGVKVSGYRGYYLKNEGVLLHLGLMWHVIKKLTNKGFQLMIPPTLVKEFALVGSGHFPAGKDEIYQIANPGKLASGEADKNPLFLVGTSEPSVLAYYAKQKLDEKDLPIKIAGFSQCYRSEVGSYGKDTKGIYRIHEFMKVEQVIICKDDIEESNRYFEEMRAIAQEILEELELPYRVVQVCTGDMGAGKYKMYDIETWMPSRDSYGETHSDSNLTDWQARRLNIKYKNAKGESRYVYTLNNTAIASPRILIAILENYQQKDGSIIVPEVLREWVGKEKLVIHTY